MSRSRPASPLSLPILLILMAILFSPVISVCKVCNQPELKCSCENNHGGHRGGETGQEDKKEDETETEICKASRLCCLGIIETIASVGFTYSGFTAGIGKIAAGSLFASFQSAAATTLISSIGVGSLAATGGAFAAGFGSACCIAYQYCSSKGSSGSK